MAVAQREAVAMKQCRSAAVRGVCLSPKMHTIAPFRKGGKAAFDGHVLFSHFEMSILVHFFIKKKSEALKNGLELIGSSACVEVG